MAKNTAVQILDDLSGEPAQEQVRFGLDGVDYDIDLSDENADGLREILARYVEKGRRTGGRKRQARRLAPPKRGRRGTSRGAAKTTAKAVRAEEKPKPAATRKRATTKTAAAGKTTASTKTTASKAKAPARKPAAAKTTAVKSGSKTTAAKTTARKTSAKSSTTKTATAKTSTTKSGSGSQPTAKKPSAARKTGSTEKASRRAPRKAPPVVFSAAEG